MPTPEGIISTSTGPVDQAPTTEVVEDDGVVETEPEVQE